MALEQQKTLIEQPDSPTGFVENVALPKSTSQRGPLGKFLAAAGIITGLGAISTNAHAQDAVAHDSAEYDANSTDGGETDAGTTDAGTQDAGTPDTGSADPDTLDTGVMDATTPEADPSPAIPAPIPNNTVSPVTPSNTKTVSAPESQEDKDRKILEAISPALKNVEFVKYLRKQGELDVDKLLTYVESNTPTTVVRVGAFEAMRVLELYKRWLNRGYYAKLAKQKALSEQEEQAYKDALRGYLEGIQSLLSGISAKLTPETIEAIGTDVADIESLLKDGSGRPYLEAISETLKDMSEQPTSTATGSLDLGVIFGTNINPLGIYPTSVAAEVGVSGKFTKEKIIVSGAAGLGMDWMIGYSDQINRTDEEIDRYVVMFQLRAALTFMLSENVALGGGASARFQPDHLAETNNWFNITSLDVVAEFKVDGAKFVLTTGGIVYKEGDHMEGMYIQLGVLGEAFNF